jgi:hypothetical protein
MIESKNFLDTLAFLKRIGLKREVSESNNKFISIPIDDAKMQAIVSMAKYKKSLLLKINLCFKKVKYPQSIDF